MGGLVGRRAKRREYSKDKQAGRTEFGSTDFRRVWRRVAKRIQRPF
jgi:hypothetical protein